MAGEGWGRRCDVGSYRLSMARHSNAEDRVAYHYVGKGINGSSSGGSSSLVNYFKCFPNFPGCRLAVDIPTRHKVHNYFQRPALIICIVSAALSLTSPPCGRPCILNSNPS